MVRSGSLTEQAFSPTSSTCSIFVSRHALYNFFQRFFFFLKVLAVPKFLL